MATRFTQSLSDLLTDLADYRMLSLSQFAHLHFGGKRAARRRMQQLLDGGLVELLAGAPAQRGGRPENVYGLSKAGLQLLKSEKALDQRFTFEQVGGENLTHQAAHQLLLGWCRLHLVHLCRTCPRLEFRLLTCNSPLALNPETGVPIVRTQVGLGNDTEVHITPDAAFILTDCEQPKSLLFFLEVDMGTEPLASEDGGDIREKINRYKHCFRATAYKRYETIWAVPLKGFRLLFLTDSASRLGPLCSTVRGVSPSGFVWATSADRMFAEGISGAIWVPGGHTDQVPESILGGLVQSAPLPGLSE